VSRILIADDEASIRFVLREAFASSGHELVEAKDGEEARALLERELRGRGPEAPLVVIITAQNSFENAIEAMKRGAFDYLTMPFDLAQVEALVEKAQRQNELRAEVAALRRRVGESFRSGDAIVGSTPEMVDLFKTIGRVAQSEADVLILGESGTGKEIVARAIHYHSPRREAPAELFGHERGAFTGATDSRVGRFRDAAGGTLLLDEIGDLPLPLQAKLLRVLQEREVRPVGGQRSLPVDVRILAATHQDLEAEIKAGRFREDLYFRLNVVPVRIIPLRERQGDIPALVHHFVERFSRELGVPARWPTEDTLERLRHHHWPGNVRELENVIKRALVLASGDVLTPEDIEIASDTGASGTANWTDGARRELGEMLSADAPGPFWELVHRLERAVLEEALTRSSGNQIRAAAMLGINRNTLRKKLIELEIDPQSPRRAPGPRPEN
jgi:two-component system nitrogen regulation response regulator GlnG